MSELMTAQAPEAGSGKGESEPLTVVAEPEVANLLIADAVSDKAHRSAALDALRAIAALMVVGMHTVILAPEPVHPNPVLHLVRSHLWTGVDLFFSLSGFLIAGPWLRALLEGRALPERGGYVARRVARIVPGYWVALTAVILLVAPAPLNPAAVVSHYLFVHNWVPGESRDLFVVAWTLAIEIFFYLLVPVGAILIRRRHPEAVSARRLVRIVVGIGLVSLVWSLAWGLAFDHVPLLQRHVDDWRTVITDNLPAQLVLFCPGMLLALLVAERERAGGERRWWERLPSSVWLAISVVVWLAAIAAGAPQHRFTDAIRDELLMPIACGIPLLVFLRGGPVVRWISRWLAPVGVISYGVYLWHWTVGMWLSAHGVQIATGGQWLDWLIAFALLCAIALPISLVSWVVVERPALRRTAAWNERRAARVRAA